MHAGRALRRTLLMTITLPAMGAALAAAPAPIDTIPTATARAVVARTLELVETQALYPRDRTEYAAAKAHLTKALDGAGDEVDRDVVIAPIAALLKTLDADHHAFIMAPRWQQYNQQALTTARAQPEAQASSFALMPSARGQVLRWTPPQSLGDIRTEAPLFLARFLNDHAATPGADKACALVVDLRAQIGGNAWPPLFAMHPLFSQSNRAWTVNRDGVRTGLVDPQLLRLAQTQYGGGSVNPLQRFAGTSVAVVVDSKTASAGEMLLVALMGEGARVRTFGQTSHGATTANVTHILADGSLLALTTARYAVGDGAPIRGGIPAQVPARTGATVDEAARDAAEWASQASPSCGKGP
jgi:hypothetical protein